MDEEDGQQPSTSHSPKKDESIFHSEGKYRKRKLRVSDQIFYVNESYLGEISPVFDAMFTHEFADRSKDVIQLIDENAAEFDVFLHAIGSELGRRSFGFIHVPSMLRMADKYHVKFLISECAKIIHNDKKEDSLFRHFDLEAKLSLLQQVLAYEDFDANVLPYLIGTIGSMHDKEELRIAQAHHLTPSCVAVAIFDVAGCRRHQKEFWHDNQMTYCEKPDCRKAGTDFCECCESYLCSEHVDDDCIQAWKRMETSLLTERFLGVESLDYRTESRRTILFGRLRKRKWKDVEGDKGSSGDVSLSEKLRRRRSHRNRFWRFDDHSYGADENAQGRVRRRPTASRGMVEAQPPIDPAVEEQGDIDANIN